MCQPNKNKGEVTNSWIDFVVVILDSELSWERGKLGSLRLGHDWRAHDEAQIVNVVELADVTAAVALAREDKLDNAVDHIAQGQERWDAGDNEIKNNAHFYFTSFFFFLCKWMYNPSVVL